MKDVVIGIQDSKALLTAIRTLTVGKLACLPTDTLYGIHGLATFPGMSRKLAMLKGETGAARPFILLAHEVRQVEHWALLDDYDRQFLAKYCPGPVSVILKAAVQAPPEWVSTDGQGQRRIAFRIPDVPFLSDLLQVLAAPLFSTSANLSGQAPLESASEIARLFGDKVDLIVSDPELERRIAAEGAAPSALVDLTCRPPKVLREGRLPFVLTMQAPMG